MLRAEARPLQDGSRSLYGESHRQRNLSKVRPTYGGGGVQEKKGEEGSTLPSCVSV